MDTFIESNEQKTVNKHTIRDLLDLIFKRFILFIGLPILIIAGVVAFSLTLPKIYESKTRLKIEDFNFDNLGIGGITTDRSDLFSRRDQMINSEINVIKGNVVLQPVVEKLKLHDYWELGGSDENARVLRAVNILSKIIDVETIMDSWVIEINVRMKDAELSAQVANLIAEQYIETQPTLNTRPGAYSFYKEQWEKEKRELNGLQDQFRAFKRNNRVVNYDAEVEQKIESRGKYEERLTEIKTNILSKKAKIDKIEQFIRNNPGSSGLVPIPEIAQDRLISSLMGRLADYRLQLSSLLERYTEQERQVTLLKKQIGQVENEIRTEVENILDRERADLNRLESNRSSLQASISQIDNELLSKTDVESQYKNLEQQIEVKKEIVNDLNRKMTNSLYAGQTDARLGKIKQINAAIVPIDPVAPDLRFILLATIPLAFIFGLAVVMMMDYFDRTFSSPEKVETILNVPVLATINQMKKKSEPLFK
jgi:succinoglycan biosynthesis transport protein ExoP